MKYYQLKYLERIKNGTAGLDAFTLKILAAVTMLIDHVGCVFFPENIYFRIVGRLAFPIFAFLIVEGYYHTKDMKKYLIRLFIFAIISELPFDLAFYNEFNFEHQNVLFTFIIAILAMVIDTRFKRSYGIVAAMVLAIIAEFLRFDYGMFGVIIVMVFYWNHNLFLNKLLIGTGALLLLAWGIQQFAAFAMVPIALYNGKRGITLKYFFYIYYPLHLFLIFIVMRFLL